MRDMCKPFHVFFLNKDDKRGINLFSKTKNTKSSSLYCIRLWILQKTKTSYKTKITNGSDTDMLWCILVYVWIWPVKLKNYCLIMTFRVDWWSNTQWYAIPHLHNAAEIKMIYTGSHVSECGLKAQSSCTCQSIWKIR